MARRRTPPAALKPTGLGPRGRALWAGFGVDAETPADRVVLVVEACRIADRLEQYARLERGDIDDWATVVDSRGSGGELVLRIDQLIAQQRADALAYARIVGQLNAGDEAATEGSGSVDDELDRRRAARRAGTAGR